MIDQKKILYWELVYDIMLDEHEGKRNKVLVLLSNLLDSLGQTSRLLC